MFVLHCLTVLFLALTPCNLHSFAIVVAFLVSPFSNIERPWKPFNPILGETFEWRDGDLQFLCEQVCHHPPVSAGHGENKHFVYDIVSAPKTKFLGNSIDIYPIGTFCVRSWGDAMLL